MSNQVELLETEDIESMTETEDTISLGIEDEETVCGPKIVSRIVRAPVDFKRGQRWWKRRATQSMPRESRIKKTRILSGSPTRVVVRLGPDVPAEDELLILGALRELKFQHNSVQLEYVTTSNDIYRLLRGQWFLRTSYLVSPDEDLGNIVGTSVELVVSEPSQDALLKTEQMLYDRKYEIEVRAKREQQEKYQKAGMKDLVVPIPDYNFQSKWHKINGYLYQIGNELGIAVAIPEDPISPYGTVPSRFSREAIAKIERARIFNRPFALYDLGGDPAGVLAIQGMATAFPGVSLTSAYQLEGALDSNMETYLAICSRPECIAVLGNSGKLLVAAWAAMEERARTSKDPYVRNSKKPYILELYKGSNSKWDGCGAKHSYVIPRDAVPNDQLAGAVFSSFKFMSDTITKV